jgi:hypothetical protein
MERKEEKDQINLIQDYQTVFGTDEGKRVLKDILSQGFVDRPHPARDDFSLAVCEGRRNLALCIQGMVNNDLSQLKEKLRDNRDDEEKFYSDMSGEKGDYYA